MTRTFRSYLPLLALLGCTTQAPPPKNGTCWPNTSPTNPRYQGCDEQRCVENTTAVVVDTADTSEAEFFCQYCGGLRPADIATDQDGKIASQVRFSAAGLGIELRFDNRAMQDPITLEKLQKYARDADVSYSPPQGGTLTETYLPFDVVAYESGRMHVRIATPLHSLTYWVDASPCLPGGHGCGIQCTYDDATYGGAGEAMQFSADLFAPLVVTPMTY